MLTLLYNVVIRRISNFVFLWCLIPLLKGFEYVAGQNAAWDNSIKVSTMKLVCTFILPLHIARMNVRFKVYDCQCKVVVYMVDCSIYPIRFDIPELLLIIN